MEGDGGRFGEVDMMVLWGPGRVGGLGVRAPG